MAFWTDPSSVRIKQQHRWVIRFYDATEPDYYETAGIPSYLIKAVDKPTYEISSIQTKILYGQTINYPKRLVWKPITIVLYDAYFSFNSKLLTLAKNYSVSKTKIAGEAFYKKASTEAILYKMLLRSGYFGPNEDDPLLFNKTYHFKNNLTRTLEEKTNNRVTNRDEYPIENEEPFYSYLELTHLDDDGDEDTNDKWFLFNPIITDYKSDKLDYSSDAPSTITLTIAYDWAELFPTEQPVVERRAQTGTMTAGPGTLTNSNGVTVKIDNTNIAFMDKATERLVAGDDPATARTTAFNSLSQDEKIDFMGQYIAEQGSTFEEMGIQKESSLSNAPLNTHEDNMENLGNMVPDDGFGREGEEPSTGPGPNLTNDSGEPISYEEAVRRMSAGEQLYK